MADGNGLARERHQVFLQRVLATGEVWVLALAGDLDCWATAEVVLSATGRSGRVLQVVPVWSDAAGAARCVTNAWDDYQPHRVALPRFVNQALRVLDTQGVLVGTNWSAELAGGEVTALRLASELLEREARRQ